MRFYEATDSDLPAVLQIHADAFGREEEALRVANLLKDPTARPLLSLLVEQGARKAGHVLFTALGIHGPVEEVGCAILAPLAIEPAHQPSAA